MKKHPIKYLLLWFDHDGPTVSVPTHTPSIIKPLTCSSQVENIRRFGGSTSPAMPWPNEEHSHGDGPEDKLDRLEKIILRATKTPSFEKLFAPFFWMVVVQLLMQLCD